MDHLRRERMSSWNHRVMRRLPPVLLLGACACSIAWSSAAAARTLDSFCETKYRHYCLEARARSGRINLIFRSFAGRVPRRYSLCVTPPDGERRCKAFRLVRQRGSTSASRIDLARSFGAGEPGRYRAVWKTAGPPGVAVTAIVWGSLSFRVGQSRHTRGRI
jgi:hypothetical protein